MRTLILFSSALASLAIFTSCQTSNTAPLAGTVNTDTTAASNMFQQAEALKQQGKAEKAAKTFGKMAKEYPFDVNAAQAKYEQGLLLESAGRPIKAFDAYQDLIERYPGSKHYTPAFERQKALSIATAEGEIKNSFLGLKSRIDINKTVDMLSKVRDNAPRAESAPQAQYTIGSLFQSNKKSNLAIAAYNKLVKDYPNSRYAGDSLFNIGEIYVADARGGNQDTANLGRAREAYEDFLRSYPGHPKTKQAKTALSQLKNESLQKNFDVAEFYYNKGQYDSAVFYYKEVLRLSKGGDLNNRAKARLAELNAR